MHIKILFINKGRCRFKAMKEHESAKFERFGSFFFLLLFGIGLILPFVVSLILCIAYGSFKIDVFLIFALVFMFMIWIILLMMIAYGSFTSFFVKRTAKEVKNLPYRFNSSFKGRGGILYIDVENGMIAFISAYNPLKIQVFNASRIGGAQTIASAMTGIRFVFYLDGKKISMPTLLTNKIVSTKSGIGAEAVSKADAFVELLMTAKNRAQEGKRGH